MIVVPSDNKILLYGPKLANVVSEPVTMDEWGQLGDLRDYMIEMIRRTNAIGLTAPQIGVFKQFIVMQDENGNMMDMVNPEITRMRGKEVSGLEACLSVPPGGNTWEVPRMHDIDVAYSTSMHPKFIIESRYFHRNAVVIQHETDHLTGTFFFDRIASAAKDKVLKSFEKWKTENDNDRKNYTRPLTANCL